MKPSLRPCLRSSFCCFLLCTLAVSVANSSAGATFGRSLPLWTFSDHFGDSQETDAFSPNRHGDNGIYHSRCTFELTPLSLSETRKGLTVQEEQEKRTGEQR